MKTNHSQDAALFRLVVKWIIAGAVTGTFIGILALAGIIPGDELLPVCRIVIKAGIGLIILIIDVLFALAFCRPRIRDYIEKHGKQTDGVIEDVNETVRPDQQGSDEWVRKEIFSVTVKYHARGKEYRKVFSSPHSTSRQALYPISFEAGQVIPVKYPERFPALAVLHAGYTLSGKTVTWDELLGRNKLAEELPILTKIRTVFPDEDEPEA